MVTRGKRLETLAICAGDGAQKALQRSWLDDLKKVRDRYLDNRSTACLYSSSKLIHTINVGLKLRVAANKRMPMRGPSGSRVGD